LNNNNNNNNDQATRTEIFNEIGETSLKKLITDLEQALKAKDKKKVASKLKELQTFENSNIDYKQKAYQKLKDKINKLVSQAQSQNQSNQNKDKEGFFRPNNPLM
jgi:hypothetical protein